jgi:hypothetical protein
VGRVAGCDEELRIEYAEVSLKHILWFHGIHVMDIKSIVNFVTINTEITTIVSDNDVLTNLLPFARSVKHLVDVSIEPEGCIADSTSKR